MDTHPPKAPLCLRLGVVGHRPDITKRKLPDQDELRKIVAAVLERVRREVYALSTTYAHLYASSPFCLRIVSSLAAGPDQWVAEEGALLDYELHAVLPFPDDEYRKDFLAQPVDDYGRLLKSAKARFELDGSRDKERLSYEAAARIVLNQSDILIAIWDGKPAHGTGGTGQTVIEALARGIPVVWIDWNAPHKCQLGWTDWRVIEMAKDLESDWEHLKSSIHALLLPLSSEAKSHGEQATDCREAYFKETGEPRNPWIAISTWFLLKVWSSFRGVATLGFAPLKESQEPPLSPELKRWLDRGFVKHYAWATKLSMLYGNLYRGSFVLAFLLGAAAVFFALLPYGAGWNNEGLGVPVCAAIEAAIIFVIIILTRWGRRHHWHEQWIDYRSLAEQLRLARFQIVVGQAGGRAALPTHLAAYGNFNETWMVWHLRAVQRAAGLPTVAMTGPYLSQISALIREGLVTDQKTYHANTQRRLSYLDHRLHNSGNSLFVTTLIVCLIHLGLHWAPAVETIEWIPRWLTIGCAFLPALGAAFAAIRSQGEFHRVAQRSHAMHNQLEQIEMAVASISLTPGHLNSRLLAGTVDQIADLMIHETLDWRVMFQDRPLVWPA